MRNSLDIDEKISGDSLAKTISALFNKLNMLRQSWMRECEETRDYVFATDTRTTSNSKLPWENSTTLPKICQIFDNLKASYEGALFPHSDWLTWRGDDMDSNSKEIRKAVKLYMKHKLRQSGFRTTALALLDDVLITGNAFAMAVHERDVYLDINGLTNVAYAGPKILRIAPRDIVFDPTASSFKETPKIVRSIYTLGAFKKKFMELEGIDSTLVDKILDNRKVILGAPATDGGDGYVADGFSDIKDYYMSGRVEVLTFYGDIFNAEDGEVYSNRVIQIVDRAYVVSNEPEKHMTGYAPIQHAFWRKRPDSLYGMSPLANLVGLQYRADHLENLRADVFDQIALPTTVITGEVSDFETGPGTRIYAGTDGRVDFIRPDATALSADNQIAFIFQLMEEFAGSPRESMGFRTPGEKTAFEVQTLATGGSKVFMSKSSQLEEVFFEPLINDFLAIGVSNFEYAETFTYTDPILGERMTEITRDDIAGSGRIEPMGARHLAERALRIQQIQNLVNIKMSDPSIGAHISGKKIAELYADELKEPALYKENIAFTEEKESKLAMADEEASHMEGLQSRVDAETPMAMSPEEEAMAMGGAPPEGGGPSGGGDIPPELIDEMLSNT